MQNVLCQLVSLNVFAKKVSLEMHMTNAWTLMSVLLLSARIMLYVLTHQEVMTVDVDPDILVIHLHNVQKKMKATKQMIYARIKSVDPMQFAI
jgi:hypothetical protein